MRRAELIRQGEGPAAAHERQKAERAKERALIERIANESEHLTDQKHYGTPAGDERKLRGIPAIGRNVSGAIPGTDPDRLNWVIRPRR